MLYVVHPRVTPSIKFASTHLYTWVERGTVTVTCLVQEHNTMSQAVPGLKAIPLNPQLSALTMNQSCLQKGMVQCTCTQPFIFKVKMGLSSLKRGRWDYGRHSLLKKGELGKKHFQWEGEGDRGWDPSVKERKVLDLYNYLLRLVSTYSETGCLFNYGVCLIPVSLYHY